MNTNKDNQPSNMTNERTTSQNRNTKASGAQTSDIENPQAKPLIEQLMHLHGVTLADVRKKLGNPAVLLENQHANTLIDQLSRMTDVTDEQIEAYWHECEKRHSVAA